MIDSVAVWSLPVRLAHWALAGCVIACLVGYFFVIVSFQLAPRCA